MLYQVDVDNNHANEVAGVWKVMLDASSEMHFNGRILYATTEKHPNRVLRNMKFGKLKSMAEHEFGSEAVTFKWYPEYSIEVHVKMGDDQNFARLCAYSGEIVWGSAVTTHLGWKEDEAAKKFAAYSR